MYKYSYVDCFYVVLPYRRRSLILTYAAMPMAYRLGYSYRIRMVFIL